MTTTHTTGSTEMADALAAYSINYTDAMARMLNNGALFKQLAMHYLDDANYAALAADMEAGEYESAYNHAHTLKGVAGNLSFSTLHGLAAQLCDALSADDVETAATLMEPVKEAHERVRAGLEFWQTLD